MLYPVDSSGVSNRRPRPQFLLGFELHRSLLIFKPCKEFTSIYSFDSANSPYPTANLHSQLIQKNAYWFVRCCKVARRLESPESSFCAGLKSVRNSTTFVLIERDDSFLRTPFFEHPQKVPRHLRVWDWRQLRSPVKTLASRVE